MPTAKPADCDIQAGRNAWCKIQIVGFYGIGGRYADAGMLDGGYLVTSIKYLVSSLQH